MIKSLLLIVLASHLHAADWKAATIEIQSRPCNRPQPEIVSTGFAVKSGDETWIVASSGGTLGTSTAYCHFVVSGGTAHPITLLRSEWGQGLSLFRWSWPVNLDAVPFEALSATAEPSLLVVHTTWGLRELSEITPTSDRHFFPLASEISELSDSRGFRREEIGAPITDSEGRFYGVVSSQFLKSIPGAASRAEEWPLPTSPQPTSPEVSFVIKAAGVREFLASVSERSIFHQDQSRLITGSLAFEESCRIPSESQSEPGYPIGGADGVGIGGESPADRVCVIRVSPAPHESELAPFEPLRAWLESWGVRLAKGDSITIPLLFARGEDGELRDGRAFRSLGEFFLLLGKGYQPVDVLWRKGAQIPGNAKRGTLLHRMRTSSLDSENLTRHLFQWTEIESSRDLLRRIYLGLALVQSESHASLRRTDLTPYLNLQGKYRLEWLMMYQAYEEAPELHRLLETIHEGLAP